MQHASRQRKIRRRGQAAAPTVAGSHLKQAPLSPTNIEAIYRLALRLHHEGHHHQAERIYRKILATDPNHAKTLHLLGVLYHQLGDDERALRYLDRAVALNRNDACCFRHLGEVYRALQRFDEAVASFEHALALEPDDTDSLCNLGHALLQRGTFSDAEACYRRALARSPEDTLVLSSLGVSLMHQEKTEEARAAFRRALEFDPANDEAGHMLAALEGQRPRSSPRSYIVNLFDRYADSFDAHLVQKLHYDVPALLRKAVEETAGAAMRGWRIVDLGCGTGLCGLHFRDAASELIGVDLSPRMIEQAGRRHIYQALMVDDLAAALEYETSTVDLVLAGDVFIYVGDLEGTFRQCARALKPGGLFAFSTESCDGETYLLLPNGRFSHPERYVRHLAAAHGFDVLRSDAITIRIERGEPTPGQLYVLRA